MLKTAQLRQSTQKNCDRTKKIKAVGENASETVYLSWEDAVARAYSRYCKLATEWDKPLPYQYR